LAILILLLGVLLGRRRPTVIMIVTHIRCAITKLVVAVVAMLPLAVVVVVMMITRTVVETLRGSAVVLVGSVSTMHVVAVILVVVVTARSVVSVVAAVMDLSVMRMARFWMRNIRRSNRVVALSIWKRGLQQLRIVQRQTVYGMRFWPPRRL